MIVFVHSFVCVRAFVYVAECACVYAKLCELEILFRWCDFGGDVISVWLCGYKLRFKLRIPLFKT